MQLTGTVALCHQHSVIYSLIMVLQLWVFDKELVTTDVNNLTSLVSFASAAVTAAASEAKPQQ